MYTAEEEELKYQIIEKGQFVIVSFSGWLTKKYAPILDNCKEELATKKLGSFILDFSRVEKMDYHQSCLTSLYSIKKTLRSGGKDNWRICSGDAEFNDYLVNSALLTKNEVKLTLPEAIKSFG